MSIHRHAAKRDTNEPTIRRRFAHHGWHTEQISGSGMPDLLAFNTQSIFAKVVRLVDVKMAKGDVTKAQRSKWEYLRLQGIPVYVVRTEADVDALVGGTLEPWQPPMSERVPGGLRKRLLPQRGYTPPRSTPVCAANEAEETFAPCACTREQPCAACSKAPIMCSRCGALEATVGAYCFPYSEGT